MEEECEGGQTHCDLRVVRNFWTLSIKARKLVSLWSTTMPPNLYFLHFREIFFRTLI